MKRIGAVKKWTSPVNWLRFDSVRLSKACSSKATSYGDQPPSCWLDKCRPHNLAWHDSPLIAKLTMGGTGTAATGRVNDVLDIVYGGQRRNGHLQVADSTPIVAFFFGSVTGVARQRPVSGSRATAGCATLVSFKRKRERRVIYRVQ
jgi:hypothetical protein